MIDHHVNWLLSSCRLAQTKRFLCNMINFHSLFSQVIIDDNWESHSLCVFSLKWVLTCELILSVIAQFLAKITHTISQHQSTINELSSNNNDNMILIIIFLDTYATQANLHTLTNWLVKWAQLCVDSCLFRRAIIPPMRMNFENFHSRDDAIV